MIAGQVEDNTFQDNQDMQPKRATEIVKYKKKLENFNIELHELAQITPSCVEIRTKAIKLAKQMAQDLTTIESIKKKNCLPADQLQRIKSIFPLHMSYIIAITVLYAEGYNTLISFLQL